MASNPETTDPRLGKWRDIGTAPRDRAILALIDLNDGSFEPIVVWWSESYEAYPWASHNNHHGDRIAYWMHIEPAPVFEDTESD